ncbi:hypothetical protein C2S53_011043 [Perilla frutescens var. hirtella]|uniref:Uncharacterized protein n=1 Tax=Perilla frutescens var. hirtella TaxID=608512 RepID=A0AAD4P5Q7_PERFH|nr:hypothetical protein C2S53_011043 [Perilla frutescens var. hirtella]
MLKTLHGTPTLDPRFSVKRLNIKTLKIPKTQRWHKSSIVSPCPSDLLEIMHPSPAGISDDALGKYQESCIVAIGEGFIKRKVCRLKRLAEMVRYAVVCGAAAAEAVDESSLDSRDPKIEIF